MKLEIKGLEEVEHSLENLLENAKTMQANSVYLGVPSSRGEEPHDGTTFKMAELAKVLHFGNVKQNIPARPFLYITIDDNKSFISQIAQETMHRLAQPNSVQFALNKIASHLSGYCQEAVIGNSFKLAPITLATIKAKSKKNAMKTNPLIDTGQLRGSIMGIVGGKDEY